MHCPADCAALSKRTAPLHGAVPPTSSGPTSVFAFGAALAWHHRLDCSNFATATQKLELLLFKSGLALHQACALEA